MEKIRLRKFDWHLFWTAAAVIVSLSLVIIGCYISIKIELNTIKTVLIMKGIMPAEFATKVEGT